MFLEMVGKTKVLVECNFVTLSFDILMSKGMHDIFALVIKFLGVDWQPKHVTFGFFEVANIFEKTLAKNLIELLEKYKLRKNITYVKDKGSNLNRMITTLKIIMSCDILGLQENYQGTYFGHVFFKAC